MQTAPPATLAVKGLTCSLGRRETFGASLGSLYNS